MLRLDNSEMLPGSQKGEKTAVILKTHATFRHFDFPQLAQVLATLGTGNDHVTATRRASLIDILYARVKTVNHSKLHIRMVNSFKYDRPSTEIPVFIILP